MTNGERVDQNKVVIVAAGSAWPLYLACSAYVCPVGRTFKDVGRLGFYSGRTIHGVAASIEHVEPSVLMSQAEAAKRALSLDPTQRRIGDAIVAALAKGYDDVPSNQVLLLSGPDDDATITFVPIRHEGRNAWTMNRRYQSVASLTSATTTADLP